MKLFGAWFSGAVIADEQTQTGGHILHRDKASAVVATNFVNGAMLGWRARFSPEAFE